MSVKSTPPSQAELLRHAAWTHRLARGLAGSDAAADDVVQDTWVAALRRPPDTGQPLRPWLATVVRNLVFNRSRERVRREARENRADIRDEPASAEDLLGRLELHRTLVELVHELPASYRRIVLLAYFEGLSSAAIGAHEGLPPGTVRGRLKMSLELLRESLDARTGGRTAWMFPALELARAPASATSSAVSGHAARQGAVHHTTSAFTATPGSGIFSFSGPLAWASLAGAIAVTALVWSAARTVAPVTPPLPVAGASEKEQRRPAPDPTQPELASDGSAALSTAGARSDPTPGAHDRLRATAIARFLTSLGSRPSAQRSFAPLPSLPAVAGSTGDRGRCSISTAREGPVAEACARGGRAEARKAMKALVRQAKDLGRKYTCEGCHRDLDTYALTANAGQDFDALMLAVGKAAPAR